MTKGLHRRLTHAHHLRGVDDLQPSLVVGQRLQLAPDPLAVAHQHQGEVVMVAEGFHRTAHHRTGRVIPTHGVHGDPSRCHAEVSSSGRANLPLT